MSKQVVITCAILFIIGCFGVRNIFTPSGMNFDVSSLFAPLALILLLGISGSRIIANFVFGLNYLVMALTLISPKIPGTVLTMSGNSVVVDWDLYSVIVVFLLFTLSILLLLHWSLFLRPFEDHLGC